MEAFLYCMGAIKFISGNPRFLNEMISKGAVEILMNLIKQINDDTKKCGTCLPNSGHLLVQVSILIEKVVCVKWVFMFPRTHYLPGDCNREQVGCYLQPGGGYLALGIERSSHCPPPHPMCVPPGKAISWLFTKHLSAQLRHPFLLLCRGSRPRRIKGEHLSAKWFHAIIRILTGRVLIFRVSKTGYHSWGWVANVMNLVSAIKRRS